MDNKIALALLGAYFLDVKNEWGAEEVTANDFINHLGLKKIFDILTEFSQVKGDLLLFSRQVEGMPEAKMFINLLASAIEHCTTVVGLRDYLIMVRKENIQKEILSMAEITGRVVNFEDFDRRIKDIDVEIDNYQRIGINTKVITFKDCAANILEKLEARRIKQNDKYFSGFADFDKITDGFIPQNLYLIAGYTSQGKSAFCLNCATYLATHKVPVLYITTEMGEEQLSDRVLASYTELAHWKIKHGQLDIEETQKLVRKMTNDFYEMPLQFYYCTALTFGKIYAVIKSCKIKPEVVILDYIQQCDTSGEDRNRAYGLQRIAENLKNLAGELKINITLVSQLRRPAYEGKTKPPELSELKESSGLEQSPDVIGILWRPNKDTEEAFIETSLFIRKNRNGATGVVHLTFEKNIIKFHGKYREIQGIK